MMCGSFSQRALPALLACAAFGVGVSAQAGEPAPSTLPIAVIAVQSADADEQADALTRALRSAVKTTPGWSLSEGDYSLEVLTLSLKCTTPPDASCESRIADQIHADRFLWGSLHKKGSTVVGDLHYWARGTGSTKIAITLNAKSSDAGEDIKKAATASFAMLTGGPPKGEVAVHAGNVSGQVFVDGEPVGALTAGAGRFMLSSGTHKVTVKAAGYADAEATVDVEPVGTAEVTLTMTQHKTSQATDYRRIGGFVSLGAGVAFLGVAVASHIKVASIRYSDDWENTLAVVPNGTDDICDQARNGTLVTVGKAPLSNSEIVDRCDTSKTFEILQAIFYPAAAVAGGLGFYLLATSGSTSNSSTGRAPLRRPAFALTPRVGPGRGALDVQFRW